MNLSKSDYVLGRGCAKALWLKKHTPELREDPDNTAVTENGYDVQAYAQKYLGNGVELPVEYWEIEKGAELTKKMVKTQDLLFEAVAKLDNGAFCRIDALRKNKRGFDMIEIKSTTSLKDYHIDDLSYQYYVFKNAGYNINRCYLMHLNSQYVRGKEIDVNELFVLEDLTETIKGKLKDVPEYVETLLKYQNRRKEPSQPIAKSCKGCDFYHYCCANVPEYSIWDVLRAPQADEVCERLKSCDIEDLCAEDYDGKTKIDIEAWQKKKTYCDKKQIKEFLDRLEYPLYYLDYESFNAAIPMFENSHSYQQIPFQFSLHIQKKPNGEVTHRGFLHKKQTDPRRALAEALIKQCGKKGSIIVYNESFEKTRNQELSALFPDLADDILAINQRVVDLLAPFRSRALYCYKQHSSASIKKVLPAFSKLSYEYMEVHNGDEASTRYTAFMNGKLSGKEQKILFDGLEEYCAQDTYAMVVLMEVLYKKSHP